MEAINQPIFHELKIIKKKELAKQVFLFEFEITDSLQKDYYFDAGQYLTVEFLHQGEYILRDYSIINAPYENKISFAVKYKSSESTAYSLVQNYQEGDFLKVSLPQGRFTLDSKPNEKRTILTFATGIGITPIFSHIKNILHREPYTRLFLFYGNRTKEERIFVKEFEELQSKYSSRFFIHYFYTNEAAIDPFYHGRIDERKLKLIINQILTLDEEDEESTIWDATDEVLICGQGDMIKTIANACYQNGIRKKNIHFELFEAFEDDIYEREVEVTLVENINVDFLFRKEKYNITVEDNQDKLLNQLLNKGFKIPYSCKSGICGTCRCRLISGEVDMGENEYLTENEMKQKLILPCISVVQTDYIELDFDQI